MPKEPSIGNAEDFSAILECLRKTPVGGTLLFESLSSALGKPIQSKRHLLMRALRHINAENGAIFASVHGEGYKRMDPKECHLVGSTARSRIRHAAKYARQKITSAVQKANHMPRESALRANREIAMLGLIEHATTQKAMNAAVTEKKTPKSVAQTMADMLAGLKEPDQILSSSPENG